MAEPTTEWTIGFGRLGARIRRRWRTLGAVLVLVFLAATAAGVLAPKQYSATASVTLSPIRLSTVYSSSQEVINISTERAIIASPQVAALAAQHLTPSLSPGALVAATSAAAPAGSTVLQVTVTAPDPAAAAARANAVADAYLTFRAQSALASAQPGIAALDARIAATNPKDVATLADLNAQRTALLDVGEGTGRVIGRASSPSSPSSLGLASYLVGGLVGGLLLGALAALLRDLFDRRVRFAARYSELVRERAVVVRGLGDVEAARWLVRGIRARAALRRPVVVVTALDGTSADEVFGAMRNLARRTGMDVHVVEAEPGTGTPDQQALYQGLENGAGDLLLVNATRIASPAEQALLADAADVVLVVASARSRVRDAADAQALFDDVAAGKLLPAYLERRGKARPEPAGRSAAERKPDLAASRR